MVERARLVETPSGLAPDGDGWFVVNVRDAAWRTNDKFGAVCSFEGEPGRFPDLGFRIYVLSPGGPNCLYHAESTQEDFLVVAGECTLLVEGEERPLRAWDFVHCPANTRHVFVGAGSGPCVIVMVGARVQGKTLLYPVSELAQRHGAGAGVETHDPREAYAPFPKWHPSRPDMSGLPWS
jgi:uncharacterized cupin superfamily protein